MHNKCRDKLGFTIIELLIAVIILGILVMIIIPRISNRTKQAKINACLSELKELAEAERRLEIDYGYYGRFYMLDDVAGGDQIANGNVSVTPKDTIDGIADEDPTNVLTGIVPNPNSQNYFVYIAQDPLDTNDGLLIVNSYNFIDETRYTGPYINYRREMRVIPDNDTSDLMDIPLDPWNSPYLLFTKKGLVDEFTSTQFELLNGPTAVLAVNGDGQILATPETAIFDRLTILSLGPDSMIGDGTVDTDRFGEGDDLLIHP
jgi:prepilin-type N-terminal cleavage/methylation domain-containing protein